MSLLEVTGLRKVYTTRFGGNQVEALKNVNFSVEQGESGVLKRDVVKRKAYYRKA